MYSFIISFNKLHTNYVARTLLIEGVPHCSTCVVSDTDSCD